MKKTKFLVIGIVCLLMLVSLPTIVGDEESNDIYSYPISIDIMFVIQFFNEFVTQLRGLASTWHAKNLNFFSNCNLPPGYSNLNKNY